MGTSLIRNSQSTGRQRRPGADSNRPIVLHHRSATATLVQSSLQNQQPPASSSQKFASVLRMNRIVLLAIAFVWSVPFSSEIAAAEPPPTQQPPTPQAAVNLKRDLAGYWPLAGDARDHSGHGQHATIRGPVDLTAAGPGDRPGTAAAFDGRDAFLEIPASQNIAVASDDFSISTWVLCDDTGDDVPGDLLSQYDPARRRGFHLTLKTSAGVTTNQANYRHLQFGIDNDRQTPWTDCGRPGSAILAFALAAHDGSLYAGTCEPGAKDSGRVYRYGGEQKWIDCGSPTPANSITALAVHNGDLYAASGQYRLGGSSLEESKNANTGGRVYRFAGRLSQLRLYRRALNPAEIGPEEVARNGKAASQYCYSGIKS